MSFIKYCKSNNIESYHSGGGCIHLSYIDANNDQWLINPFDVKFYDIVIEYPTNKNQFCIFGKDDGESFLATFKDGIKKLKSM
tara:strand:- start:282 stop:530 length:249 start_codon:yes stop_codon:yes gene_type:complete